MEVKMERFIVTVFPRAYTFRSSEISFITAKRSGVEDAVIKKKKLIISKKSTRAYNNHSGYSGLNDTS